MEQATDPQADPFARPQLDDPAVRHLLGQLDAERPRDLGGTMSLNLHLEGLGLVLRVHPRFETVARLEALRALRRRLAGHGLVVGSPQTLLGNEVVDLGGRLAEAETFVPAVKPDATWESYTWMYRAMGDLHRAINASAPHQTLATPGVATSASPQQLRRWMKGTIAAVRADAQAADLAAEVSAMVDGLERQWVESQDLPQQLVHGDIRLGNVAMDDGGQPVYFDFGFAAERPRIHELAYSLFWILLRPDASGRAEDFDWSCCGELIEVYEVAAGAALLDIERSALGPYLAAVPLYFAAIANYTPDPCDHIKQEVAALRIARWVLDHPDLVRP